MGRKLPQRQIKLAGVISLLLVSLANPPRVQAQLPFGNSVANTVNYLAQKFPDNGEPKGRRRGGTSRREGCPNLKTPITALVPGQETNNESFLASTVAEYPMFWVYVPDLPAFIRSGEFVLQDKEGNDVYRTQIALPGKQGVVGISIPQNPQYGLKQNMKYHWFFRVYCGEPQNKPEYFFVDAWLQRVALPNNLLQQLNKAKPRQYTIYAANNLWYDALTSLAELRSAARKQEARSLAQDWTELFKSVGLPELASAPIVQSYGLKK